ncbi:hypothetical protein [Caulifigura coniformis]|uniref:hypothetical protein n=1 Tax=Caulifigura coniformis TaxID=2527983 RepID=UPI0018D22AD3|nr:hypothetical protein [Caulifigura coniformis]
MLQIRDHHFGEARVDQYAWPELQVLQDAPFNGLPWNAEQSKDQLVPTDRTTKRASDREDRGLSDAVFGDRAIVEARPAPGTAQFGLVRAVRPRQIDKVPREPPQAPTPDEFRRRKRINVLIRRRALEAWPDFRKGGTGPDAHTGQFGEWLEQLPMSQAAVTPHPRLFDGILHDDAPKECSMVFGRDGFAAT